MNSKQYVKNAIRTESVIAEAKVNDAELFNQVLQAFIASAALLDMYKKNIYYGKPINEQMWLESAIVLHDAGFELEAANLQELSSEGDSIEIDTRVLHATIGIATEAGELMEAVLKALVQGVPIDTVNLGEEIGDLNWYEALMVDALGVDWDEIRERNIAKLRKRYPEKFTSEKAINRDLKAERKILEGMDGCDGVDTYMICSECNGTGTLPVVCDQGHYGFQVTCSVCNGAGYKG
jgi:NTP pyrophosphatase (non-canonical NTP hydrolase)